MLLCIGLDVVMHGLTSDMLLYTDAEALVHGKIGVVNTAMKVIGLQARIKFVFRPDAADGCVLRRVNQYM